MSKQPAHKGRVVRETKLNLEPLCKSSLVPHAPPISKRGFSVDEGAQLHHLDLGHLKRKVSDLENENCRLRRQIDEAELSIQNYKSFLTARSGISNLNVSTQTECSERRNSSAENDQHIINRLHAENQNYSIEIKAVQAANKRYSQSLADLDIQITQMKIVFEQRIQELQTELEFAKCKLTKTNSSKTLENESFSSKFSIREAIRNISLLFELHKRKFRDIRQDISIEFNGFSVFLQNSISLAKSFNHSAKKTALSSLKVSVDSACSPMTPAKILKIDQGVDPLSPDQRTTLSRSSVRPKTPSNLERASSSSLPHLAPLLGAPQTLSPQPKLKQINDDYQAEKTALEARVDKQSEVAALLAERFSSASRALHAVTLKFDSELNAVKHLSHCKELVRIAALRQLGLEKDRLNNELKYTKYTVIFFIICLTFCTICLCLLRDVQSVIWFCLETAEQTLTDTHPEIVNKMTESRNKRMLLLEREALDRRKDIEQRSAETCAVNSSHLEAFQSKAELKLKKAEEEVQVVLQTLKNLLLAKDFLQSLSY
jgi:hypothetical protein